MPLHLSWSVDNAFTLVRWTLDKFNIIPKLFFSKHFEILVSFDELPVIMATYKIS